MTLELYYSPLSPPSRAVLSTMQHLGLEPKIHFTNPQAGDTRKPAFLQINPCHNIPVLNDGGFHLHESRAILMYLCNKFPNGESLYPESARSRALVDKVLFFDGTTFYPAVYTNIMAPIFRGKCKPTPENLTAVSEQLSTLEKIIGDKKFAANDRVTIADISLGVTVPIFRALVGENFLPARINEWYEDVIEAVPELKKLNDEAFQGYQAFKVC